MMVFFIHKSYDKNGVYINDEHSGLILGVDRSLIIVFVQEFMYWCSISITVSMLLSSIYKYKALKHIILQWNRYDRCIA